MERGRVSTPTTFRVDLIVGMLAMLDAFIATNPTLLRRRFKVKPASFATEFPCAYIDLRPESISHANGVRDRVISPSVVIVDKLTENGETMDRFDVLVDALVDHFTAYPHLTAGTVWDRMTVSYEAQGPNNEFAGTRFTFENVSKAEGRT